MTQLPDNGGVEIINRNNTEIETQTESVELINGWSENIDRYINIFVMKLKYNRTINSFYYFRLKSKEGLFSWCIIVLSTFTSSLNLLNNLFQEVPIRNYHHLKIFLTSCPQQPHLW